MSYMKVSGVVTAAVTALALAGGAYGDTGKSPNGAPGPAGNPNQPAAQPQANGPQGPAGNESHAKKAPAAKSHGKSKSSHGKSDASHGKSQSSHGKSGSHPAQSHANPNPGTPRKGGREDRPAGKITICHATKSNTNPYVEITISVNGLHGHGPAEDPRHHEGSWKDIIPAPEGGCPTTVPTTTTDTTSTTTTTTTTTQTVAALVAPTTPEVAVTAPAAATAPAEQAVLGVQAAGGNAPAEDDDTPGASKVLGATASGTTAPKAALAARAADDEDGTLPFTGFELAVILLAAAAALLGGFALRRATTSRS
jgi:hypothetical protein